MVYVIQSAIQYFLQVILKPILLLSGFRVGKSNVDSLKNSDSNGMLFISNHVSQLDSILIPAMLPIGSRLLPIYFVTFGKKEYSHLPLGFLYGGMLFKVLGGIITIKGLKNYSKSLEKHEDVLRKGRSLLIFPEGGIARDGHAKKIHGGAGYLVNEVNPNITLVYIDKINKTISYRNIGKVNLQRKLTGDEFKKVSEQLFKKIQTIVPDYDPMNN